MNTAPDRVTAFIVPVQFVDDHGVPTMRTNHIKLFRNRPGIAFERRIHEQIVDSLIRIGGDIVRLDGAVVMHTGYDRSEEGQRRKQVRDEKLLNLDLKERPNDAYVLFHLGLLAHQRKQHAAAAQLFAKSVAHSGRGDTHLPRAYALLGMSQHSLGRNAEAVETLDKAIALLGSHPQLLFDSAIVLTALKRYKEARARYLAIPDEVPPDSVSIDVGVFSIGRFHNLAGVCMALGKIDEAKKYFRLALAANPRYMPCAIGLFHAGRQAGDFATMSVGLDAIRAEQGLSETWAELEELRLGDLGKSPEKEFTKLIEDHPNAIGPLYGVVKQLLNRCEYDEAGPLLARLDDLGFAHAAYVRGLIAEADEDLAAAIRHFHRAVELNPEHTDAKAKLGT